MNTGEEAPRSEAGLITTVAWRLEGRLEYALEGSIFVAGSAVQWLRDGLEFVTHAAETDALARSVPDSDGVYVVPAFVGLGAPYWDEQARGTIVGLTRGSTRAHLTRATLESIAFQAISTGAFGYPPAAAARVAVRSVREWTNARGRPGRVIFCCFAEDDRRVYDEVLAAETT